MAWEVIESLHHQCPGCGFVWSLLTVRRQHARCCPLCGADLWADAARAPGPAAPDPRPAPPVQPPVGRPARDARIA